MPGNSYDVIVIGAGSVGLPIAYFLAREDLRVLVIEKEYSQGQGQNKSAIGGVRATHSDPAKISICLQSLDIFSNWEKDCGKDIGWKGGGYCYPVYRGEDESTLKNLLPTQHQYDLDISWVSPEEIIELIPGINPEGLRGGTFAPGDGQVNTLKAAASFWDESRKLGVKFIFNQRVTGLISSGGEIKGIETEGESYYAGAVVNAAGAGAREIGLMADIDIPVFPDSHEAGITSPVQPFFDPLVVDIRPGPYGKTSNFYFGQNELGQVIFCYTPSDPILGENRSSTSEFMPVISRRLIDLIPRLKNAMVRRVWRGLYPMTPDGIIILDRVREMDGFYLAVGMCGQGFMLG
ncbi:MAG: FAD-dependent oxidoreductase, partial [Candidatus Latescibacteria bacterium]|nr:FAD-dependent oxidoreductase [bacterium]MBD3423288.1 FAD-dependent oxidoreductase [Candidatus Latescibacterota bacterium]